MYSSCTGSPRTPWKTCILFAGVLLRIVETTFYLNKETDVPSVTILFYLFEE